MRTRSVSIGILTLLGGVVLAVACAHADSGSGPSKFVGTAVGSGVGQITRTISDAEPNGPNKSIQSTPVQINVSPGQNSNTIATNMRDACNANVTLIGLGYSARLIYAPTGLARLKLTRQVGSFTETDAISGPLTGYSVDPDQFTSTDAPAISPMGIVSLFGALPGLYLLHRRKKRAA